MKEIIFVTTNIGKVESAKKYLKNMKLTCIDKELSEPDVNDIDYIAEQKVLQAYTLTNKPCVSLDAGFYIPNFPQRPNFPGAFVKRELLAKMGIDSLLDFMQDVDDRQCYFKECLAYYDGNSIKKFYGYCYGSLAKQKLGLDRAEKWSDLWYVFVPQGCEKTLAQMTKSEQDECLSGAHISAFEEFAKWIGDKND